MKNIYPQVVANQKKLIHNIKTLVAQCDAHNVELVGVTKLIAGYLPIVELFVKHGVKVLGDSRIKNLIDFQHLNVQKMLLRIPMPSEVDEAVKYSDMCLISEISTIKLLNQAAHKINKQYKIILMIETGDIREGLLDKQIIHNTIKQILECSNIVLDGLGTNFACYGGTVPEISKLRALCDFKSEIEDTYNIKIRTISAGNSSHISIWDHPDMPEAINQVRFGAALLMGFGLNDEPIPFLQQYPYTVRAQIVERQIKPAASWGKTGLDAFGHPPQFKGSGDRIKAIIAIGRQDSYYEDLIPVDKNIVVLGGSSDHTILDLTNCTQKYAVGDILEFYTNYTSTLSVFTSAYVKKVIE